MCISDKFQSDADTMGWEPYFGEPLLKGHLGFFFHWLAQGEIQPWGFPLARI